MEKKFSPVIGVFPGSAQAVYPEGYLDSFSRRRCSYTCLGVDGSFWFMFAALHHGDLPAVPEPRKRQLLHVSREKQRCTYGLSTSGILLSIE
jgi:hypothetical protein